MRSRIENIAPMRRAMDHIEMYLEAEPFIRALQFVRLIELRLKRTVPQAWPP